MRVHLASRPSAFYPKLESLLVNETKYVDMVALVSTLLVF